jgi:hypothetical protein
MEDFIFIFIEANSVYSFCNFETRVYVLSWVRRLLFVVKVVLVLCLLVCCCAFNLDFLHFVFIHSQSMFFPLCERILNIVCRLRGGYSRFKRKIHILSNVLL